MQPLKENYRVGGNMIYLLLYQIPSSVLTASGSMGIISAESLSTPVIV